MKIANTALSIRKTREGLYSSNLFSTGKEICKDEKQALLLEALYRVLSNKTLSEEERITFVKKFAKVNNIERINNSLKDADLPVVIDKEKLTATLGKLINFFSEFSFEPNFRFCNTLRFALARGKSTAKEYIEHYFELIDSQYTSSILEKMKSDEFEEILSELGSGVPSNRINQRFKLYYGSQGTGKTTAAKKETENCMVCHSAMLPSDLMEDFNFNDGKAEFKPSALCKAMTEGKSIILDEINLLPFESLRFLQSLLDGKTEFVYKGHIIHIKDGFKVIGTMNLNVNGCVYSLPEPLVDRCEEIRKFKLTADNLLGAIL